jgi:hypothetical protein
MLEQLEIYINAQKTIANYMLAMGFIMLLFAVVIHFSGLNAVLIGLKIGLIIFGLFSSVSGIGYKMTEEKLLKNQTLLYKESSATFHPKEKERMAKVVNNHPKIQIVLVILIIVSLLINLFIDKALVKGILFSLVIFSVGNLIIESVSKKSIDTYFEQLLSE